MTFVYDELNRLTKQRNQLLEETQYFYFGDGLLKERKEPQSPLHRMTFSYNPQGSLQTVTDGENHVWTYAYYPNQTLQAVTDANQNTVTFSYYKDNLVKQVSQPEGQVTGYEYDANRHQRKLTDGLGQVIETGYDDEERVAQVDYRPSVQNPNPAGVRKLEYGYYPEGNVQQVRETFLPPQLGPTLERTCTMGYDVRERLTVERRVSPLESTTAREVGYGYDNADNLRTVSAPTQPVRTVTYDYDGQNRLETMQSADTAVRVRYERYANGLLQRVRYENGGQLERTFGYDNANRVTLVTNQSGANNERFEYEYDPNGNRSVERRRQDSLLLYERRYDYDKTDRLKEIRWNAQQTLAYGYDNVGNRKSELGVQADGTPVNVTYSYDGANRLKDIRQTNTNALVAQYQYNQNGNVTTWTSGTTSWTYTYDIRDEMVAATRSYLEDNQPKTATSLFDNDYLKRRIGRMNPQGEWTRLVFAGSQVLSEHSQENALVNRYEYGLEVVRGETDGFYFSDGQGSITMRAANQTAAAQFTQYDPWGRILDGARTGSTIGYTGQWGDGETGLVAMGNGERYYDPTIGRFVQEDSLFGMVGMPATLNRYSYVHNNPLRYTDPSGHFIETAADIAFVADDAVRVVWNLGIGDDEGAVEAGWDLVRDGIAAVIPFLPAGGSRLFKTAKFALHAAHARNTAYNVYHGARGAYDAFAKGETTQAVVMGAMTALGAASLGHQAVTGIGKAAHGLNTLIRESTLAEDLAQVGNRARSMKAEIGAAWKRLTGNAGKLADDLPKRPGALAAADEAAQAESHIASKADDLEELESSLGGSLVCELANALCFAAGTKVAVRDGFKKIEDIRIGDEVLSFNPETKQNEYKAVTALSLHPQPVLLTVNIEGESTPLKVTVEHPFLARRARSSLPANPDDDSGEWLPAGELREGDALRTASGNWAKVISIGRNEAADWAYNFTIEDNHSYFVGLTKVLVHNAKKAKPNCKSKKTAFPHKPMIDPVDDPEYLALRKKAKALSDHLTSFLENTVDYTNKVGEDIMLDVNYTLAPGLIRENGKWEMIVSANQNFSPNIS